MCTRHLVNDEYHKRMGFLLNTFYYINDSILTVRPLNTWIPLNITCNLVWWSCTRKPCIPFHLLFFEVCVRVHVLLLLCFYSCLFQRATDNHTSLISSLLSHPPPWLQPHFSSCLTPVAFVCICVRHDFSNKACADGSVSVPQGEPLAFFQHHRLAKCEYQGCVLPGHHHVLKYIKITDGSEVGVIWSTLLLLFVTDECKLMKKICMIKNNIQTSCLDKPLIWTLSLNSVVV